MLGLAYERAVVLLHQGPLVVHTRRPHVATVAVTYLLVPAGWRTFTRETCPRTHFSLPEILVLPGWRCHSTGAVGASQYVY